jgi:hypothetical protein
MLLNLLKTELSFLYTNEFKSWEFDKEVAWGSFVYSPQIHTKSLYSSNGKLFLTPGISCTLIHLILYIDPNRYEFLSEENGGVCPPITSLYERDGPIKSGAQSHLLFSSAHKEGGSVSKLKLRRLKNLTRL